MIIGELYDYTMAQQLKDELLAKSIVVEVNEVQQLATNQKEMESIYQLTVDNEEDGALALEFFRIRMGLPGARRAPDPQWQKIHALKMGTVTKVLLVISLVIYLVKVVEPQMFEEICSILFINKPRAELFENVSKGELWRLITPIFLHFNFMHILFNGMWIKDLGAVFESQKGSRSFIVFIIAISMVSNVLQYMAMGPRFGGLSGLVYGLLGYLWVYGSSHKEASIRLPKRDLYIIIGWYFLCLTGVMGPIANVAHGAGLGLGMVWGLFPLNGESKIKQRVAYVLMAIFFAFGTYAIEALKDLWI